MSNSEYWKERMAQAQDEITRADAKIIEKKLLAYYNIVAEYVLNEFEAVYDKLLSAKTEGKKPSPADLYKLDKYWAMQVKLKEQFLKLGEKENKLFDKQFEKHFFNIYDSIEIPQGVENFNRINKENANKLISGIWCADGKNYSSRVWEDKDLLLETLNEQLINCVAAGRKPEVLKTMLQERLGISYNRANTLVRTELSHIQNVAAKQRYEDYGIQKVMVWADKDERRCEVCGKLHKKVYPIGAELPVPAHPNCRCTIVPVVEN